MEYMPYDPIARITENLSDRLFDENTLYSFLENTLYACDLIQSLKLLPYVRKMHAGQVRSGKDHVPYYTHPLQVACHALALGFIEDDLISAALLHDICEDCEILPEELPASTETQSAVALLTKEKISIPTHGNSEECRNLYHEQKQLRNSRYYAGLRTNRIAAIVKLLDRCNNLSCMSAAWSHSKLAEYILETEEFVCPLLEYIRNTYPKYAGQCFLISYHMKSVMETVRHLIAVKQPSDY